MKDPDHVVLIWYALAAVSGGLGGCGAAAIVSLAQRRQLVWSFLFAYLFIGMLVGLITYGFGAMVGIDVTDTDALVLWSILCGSGVPVFVFLHNWSASIVLKKLGVEVQITLRKNNEDRRDHTHDE